MAFEMPNFGGGDGDEDGREGHPAGSGGSGSGGGHRAAFGVPPRRTRVLAITLVILVLLIAAFLLFDTVYTSYLWYRSVGVAHVYRTRMVTEAVLFLVFGALMAVVVGANIWLAHRFRPPLTGVSLEQQALDRYRMALGPFLPWILVGVSLLLGIAAGTAATGAWRTYLLWSNSVPFGTKDAQFHKDIGFYVFTLPWLRHVQGFLLATMVVSLLAALLTHYLFAGVAVTPPTGSRPSGSRFSVGHSIGSRATRAAQVHISILLGLLVLVKAYAYWLDRYALTVAASTITDGWSGPTYKSVHAVLPAKTILLVIAVLCAVLFFGNAARLIASRNLPGIDRGGHPWALPALGVSLMVLASVVIGGVYPLVVQQLQVNPSQGSKEAPYIQKNIDATRAAYGLDDVEVRQYDAKTDATRNQLAADAETVTQIRIMDPSVISATYDQQQQVRGFYTFPDDLAVDRYPVGGKAQDTVVAVRRLKLDGIPSDQRNWVNDHLKYTHGYGVVAAKGNAAGSDGSPDYVERDLPATGALGDYEQRVYFSAGLPDYSIVGGTGKSTPAEFDYPGDQQQQTTTYTGKGGVPVGSFLNKLLYAVKFQEPKILLSNGVNQDSRILYDRDPKQRVQAVAPWLTIDGTTYPVVVGGRIEWVVDGYTTTDSYPYSTSTRLQDVAKDSQADTAHDPLNAGRVNYVRNSVKATVDAYDGTVTLYAWDESDPILKTWMKAFPGTVKPRSAISPDLLAHLRYPQDLFKAQRDILGRYHVTNPQEFFGGSSFWSTPNDPTKDPASAQPQPPYYLTLQMPGQQTPAFSLTSTMVPTKRSNLAAFMAVDSDSGPDYGKIRVLEIPTNSAIKGPEQVQNIFHNTFVDKLNLLRTGGATKVIEGNLLTLPVGNGLLYVEPVYVQPQSGQSTYPLLKSVMVAFGDKMAFEATLQQGLDEVFAGSAGATTGENPVSPTQPPTTSGPTAPGPTPPSDQLKAALDDATKAQNDAAAALAKSPPDWKAFGDAQQRLQDALTRAQSIEAGQQPK
ncbi:UPF0182 family protein [Catenulispora subtropica]|uniref:UPF0182 protein GCM10009838_55480 n=1 Tax=Catenulispora subtropica TaxID=450798 RepID=A0ABP5DWV6_9ACTN